MFSYGRIRTAFAYAFPLVLGILYILAGDQVLQNNRQKVRQAQTSELLNRASLIAANLKSEYSASLQIEKAFLQVFEQVGEATAQGLPAAGDELASLIEKSMPAHILAQARIWAFNRTNNTIELCERHFFMKTKRRAMEKLFGAMIALADLTSDESSRRSSEKFISGLFGENSAPEYLASQRIGVMTPVQFEGQPHYVYWQRFFRHGNCIGGLIALFPGNFIENTGESLRNLAKSFANYGKNDLTVCFAASPLVDYSFSPITGHDSHSQALMADSLLSAREVLYQSKNVPMRELHKNRDWWHYIDSLSLETHYLVIISGRISQQNARETSILLPATVVFSLLWSAFFFLRLRHNRFSLSFAFKMLFFMTGMLPVFGFVTLGSNLIDQSHEGALQKTVSQTRANLQQIDERSEESTAQTGLTIKEFLAFPQIHRQLVSKGYANHQKGFSLLKNHLQQRGFFLRYLLLIKPGETPEYHVSTPSLIPFARYHLEYYTISAASLNKLLTAHQPNCQPISLSPSQKTLAASMGGVDNPSAKDVFLSSLERINLLQAGRENRHVFFTTILENEGKIGCYLVLGMDLEDTVQEVIKDELGHLNSNGISQYFCFSRDYSSGLQVFPKNLRFLKSTSGKSFRQFLESAASSVFWLTTRQTDEIFVYEPLNKARHYYGGAIISLAGFNAEKDIKVVLLAIMTAILSGTIYLLASAVSSLMIQPVGNLNRVFAEVAAGNYGLDFKYPFNNELGQLAAATAKMIKGLKERTLLGKFVSTTFNAGVKLSHQHASGQDIAGAVLFTDIRSFTTISESHNPAVIGDLLNEHLREMVDIINQNAGQVEQFIGDAIVAFFPGDGAVAGINALSAATQMMHRHHELQNSRREQAKVTYDIGIGLDYGSVMAGILNSGSRSEFTIIGVPRSRAEFCESTSKTGLYTKIIVTSELIVKSGKAKENFIHHQENLFELKTLEMQE